MVKIFIVATAMLLSVSVAASDTFRFFGSAGAEGQWLTAHDTSPLNPGDFLNLRRNSNNADVTGFADLSLPDHVDKLHAKLRVSSIEAGQTTTKLTIDELYWQHSFGSAVDVTAGRKIEKWGTGYAWNPTGFVNPRKDPSDPGDRLSSYRGLDMVELGVFFHDWNISLLALPTVDWNGPHAALDGTAWAFRAYRLIRGTDFSLVASGGPGARREGLSVSRVFGAALEMHGEAAWSQSSTRNVPAGMELVLRRADFVQYVAGGQFTFPHDVNVVAEYFHNGNGYTAAEWKSFGAATASATQFLDAGDPRPLLKLNGGYNGGGIGRDYTFERLDVPLHDHHFELEAISITNLRDASGLVRLVATWKLRNSVQFYVSETEFWGGPSSEFHYLQVKRLAFAGSRFFF
jgi:hypothetical protein